jgi:hypothetical protein
VTGNVIDNNRKRLLPSVPETQAMLGDIGRTKVWQLIRGGELVRVNLGRRTLVTAKSVEALVDRLEDAAEANRAR